MAETGEKYTVARRMVIEDAAIRAMLHGDMKSAGISRIEIERTRDQVRVGIYSSRPGIVIGPRVAEPDRIRANLAELTGTRVALYIWEVHE
jgi:small subunit ribosomal protein S3